MTLAAGALHQRVTLRAPQVAQDASTGAVLVTFAPVADVWAEIVPVSVRDFVQSAAHQSKVSARIRIRTRGDVAAGWQVVHGARVYLVEGVLGDPQTGREFVTLACSEGATLGG